MKHSLNSKKNLYLVLEKITRSSYKTTLIFYPVLILVFLFLGKRYSALNFFESAVLFLGGIIIWTLLEYIFNRFTQKIDLSFPALKKFNYVIHGIHYNNPKNQDRLFMAPVPGLLLSFFTFAFWYLFLRNGTFSFMAGLITGYLFYAIIHYAVHRKPGKIFFHTLWIHHLKHHHKHRDKAFGVTSPLWDFVFGTMPPKDEHSRRQFS